MARLYVGVWRLSHAESQMEAVYMITKGIRMPHVLLVAISKAQNAWMLIR